MSMIYLKDWIKFEQLAKKAMNDELNAIVNKSWRDNKYDAKKLCETIDWKGKAEMKIEKAAHESDTMKYFTAIFQSNKTKDHPTVSNITNELESYNNYKPSLDDPYDMGELEVALKEI